MLLCALTRTLKVDIDSDQRHFFRIVLLGAGGTLSQTYRAIEQHGGEICSAWGHYTTAVNTKTSIKNRNCLGSTLFFLRCVDTGRGHIVSKFESDRVTWRSDTHVALLREGVLFSVHGKKKAIYTPAPAKMHFET